MRPTWMNGRWHVAGRPIHAGCQMEVRWPDGTWQRVRIETAERGVMLFAHFDYHGKAMVVELDDPQLLLGWPQREACHA